MKQGKRRHDGLAGLLVVAVVGLTLPGTTLAATDDESPETGWSLRFYAAAIDMDQSPTRSNGAFGRASYDVDYGGGLGVNAEYRFSRRLGVDLGALAGAGVDLVARTAQVGQATWLVYDTVSFTPLTVGLDVHMTPDSRVDVYVCPMVAWIRYGGLAVSTGTAGVTTEVDFDDDFGVGAALGLGVPFGRDHWSFEANLAYLDSAMSGRGRNGLRVDNDYGMTIFGVGFGYRF